MTANNQLPRVSSEKNPLYLIRQPPAEEPFTATIQAGRYQFGWFRPDAAKAEKTG